MNDLDLPLIYTALLRLLRTRPVDPVSMLGEPDEDEPRLRRLIEERLQQLKS